MKNINRIFNPTLLFAGVALILSSFFFSCEDDKNNPLEEKFVVSQIDLHVTNNLPLLIGKDSLIQFSVYPENATNKNVIWKSLNPELVTVTNNGLISAKGLGKTTIIIQPEVGYAATAKIDVEVLDKILFPTKLEITNTELEIYATMALQLDAVFSPANVTYNTLKWTSENPAIATVTDKGLVKGISAGKVKITAQTIDGSNVKATVEVTIKETIAAQDITINANPDDLGVYEVYPLDYTLMPSDATPATVNWKSSNPSIVSIEEGILTAHATGTVTITATPSGIEDKKVEIEVTVVNGKVCDDFRYMPSNVYTPSHGATSKLEDGKLIVNYASGGKRSDLARNGGGYIDIDTYPIIAVKMKTPATENDKFWFNLDFYSSELGVGVTNNRDLEKNTFHTTDGARVAYSRMLQDKFKGGPKKISIFQVKMGTDASVATGYDVYWIRTFKTVEDLKAFLGDELVP